ncbi:MAG: hypothetical protein QM621_00715 [Aeromicrobium sp.]|uniref:hypothetical protein n=1 Tax=Aeromicrobium sp. TaxID=1871063 RepID=UPI0039E4980E
MPRSPRIPDELRGRPFSVAQARAAGVSPRMLQGAAYRRVFPRVWVVRGHDLTPDDWVTAARLTLPRDARLTGITRIQRLGLDHGPRFPMHFVVARDYHRAPDEIMLHRTDRMPVSDGEDVSPTAAFIAYCAVATAVDAILVGDWLVREGQMSVEGLVALARHDHWRDGSPQAVWVAAYLDGRSWSPAESRIRSALVFAGLPCPESNVEIADRGSVLAIVDLAYLRWNTVVEYEGRHHQTDRRQYLRDIERYGPLRDLGLRYVQVTKEHASNLVTVVRRVHEALVKEGYDGPAPEFGERWRTLFQRLPAPPLQGAREVRQQPYEGAEGSAGTYPKAG